MVGRQYIDQRAEPQSLGALRDGGQEHTGRRRQIERRRMMLAHMVGAKSGPIVELDQLQAILILFGERIWSVIVLVEDSELHHTTPSDVFSGLPDRWRPARRKAMLHGKSPLFQHRSGTSR